MIALAPDHRVTHHRWRSATQARAAATWAARPSVQRRWSKAAAVRAKRCVCACMYAVTAAAAAVVLGRQSFCTDDARRTLQTTADGSHNPPPPRVLLLSSLRVSPYRCVCVCILLSLKKKSAAFAPCTQQRWALHSRTRASRPGRGPAERQAVFSSGRTHTPRAILPGSFQAASVGAGTGPVLLPFSPWRPAQSPVQWARCSLQGRRGDTDGGEAWTMMRSAHPSHHHIH